MGSLEDWIREHLSEPAENLLHEAGSLLRLSLAALLAEVKVAGVNQAAEQLQVTKEEVENCARQSPDKIGFLGGSEPAVFERISSRPGTTNSGAASRESGGIAPSR